MQSDKECQTNCDEETGAGHAIFSNSVNIRLLVLHGSKVHIGQKSGSNTVFAMVQNKSVSIHIAVQGVESNIFLEWSNITARNVCTGTCVLPFCNYKIGKSMMRR
jgi:hypothetical protein